MSPVAVSLIAFIIVVACAGVIHLLEIALVGGRERKGTGR